jgi:hypothetical protein
MCTCVLVYGPLINPYRVVDSWVMLRFRFRRFANSATKNVLVCGMRTCVAVGVFFESKHSPCTPLRSPVLLVCRSVIFLTAALETTLKLTKVTEKGSQSTQGSIRIKMSYEKAKVCMSLCHGAIVSLIAVGVCMFFCVMVHIYIYIYIYVCVCVCLCLFFVFFFTTEFLSPPVLLLPNFSSDLCECERL